LIGFGNLVGSLSHSVLYLQGVLSQLSPSSDFGENQLSRGLISLSLLLSSHLKIFQHLRVRSSIWCYPNFNLLKSRSPPLRVYCPRLGRAIGTRFRFASTVKPLRLATDNNSQTHYAKGKRSPSPFDCRQMAIRDPSAANLLSTLFLLPFPSGRGQMDWAPTHCMHLVAGTISLP
jgi:hypothetical protein